MRIAIVCGGRDFQFIDDDRRMLSELLRYLEIKAVFHGDSQGADRSAAEVAVECGRMAWAYPAKWDEHGRAAGPRRNREMAAAARKYAGWGDRGPRPRNGDSIFVIAFPGGRGTQDMMRVGRDHAFCVIPLTSRRRQAMNDEVDNGD